jgi:Na+-transporting methylmalonyl-CoA/oxaloacetate decarboxylase gamma subunit
VLEGEVARRFIKEAKANEKKRGTIKFTEEEKASFKAIIEDARKRGVL